MKKKAILLLCCGLLFAGLAYSVRHSKLGVSAEPSKLVIAAEHSKRMIAVEPWTPAQLESPEDLANIIKDPKAKQPIIFCIGPGAVIKGSNDIGPARDSLNLVKFKQQLIHLPKDAEIIIYCGCCPFEHCPNIRPAFALLNQMAFTRQKLLNIEHNVKIDWINKGYPVIP
jgi:thiosulfate/3-mercaptopyruvate sulfurtransferase